MDLRATRTVFIVSLLLLGIVPPARGATPGTATSGQTPTSRNCRDFVRLTWKLDLAAQRLQRKTDPQNEGRLCEPLPAFPAENALLELRQGNQPLFSRKIFLATDVPFDRITKGRITNGGVQLRTTAIFSSLIPAEALGKKDVTLTLSDLRNGRILATGSP